MAFALFYFLEVTYFPVSFVFLSCFSTAEALTGLDYCAIIIGSVVLLGHTALLSLRRVYGNYAMAVPLLLVFLNPYVGLFAVFGVTLLSIYRENASSEGNKGQNAMYFAIAVTCLWSYL